MKERQPHSATLPTTPLGDFVATTLAGFARRCGCWGIPLCLLCLLVTAWHWSRPGPYSLGAPFMQAAALLALAALLLHLPSFWLQRTWLRARLQTGKPINAASFTLRFYLINLGLAVALSALLWQPLLQLLFFHRLYPVVFWLLPWQAPLAWMLGRWLQREAGLVPPA